MLKFLLKLATPTALLTLGFILLSPSDAHAESSSCTNHTLAVNLSATDPTVYHVFGQLCSQGPDTGKTVQLLVHGATYDHNYWNWTLDPSKYSYVKRATDAGFATFDIDRLGIGLSDHPNDALVTLDSNAFVIKQIISDLRDGTVDGNHFGKVISVGHSLGSAILLETQHLYNDSDGLVISGLMHTVNASGVSALGTDIYPAGMDPKFANSGFSAGYLTTKPGTRGPLFYSLPDADPQVIALDEVLKQTTTSGELSTSFAADDPAVSLSINVPVLVAVGQNDQFFCNSSAALPCDTSGQVLQREQVDYSSRTCLEAFSLSASGHDVNLHFNAVDWFNVANDWASRRVGPNTATLPSQPCN